MAIRFNGSALEGRVGNLIFYRRDGKQFVRSAPNKTQKPKSPAQLLQQAKFKKATEWLKPLKELLSTCFMEGNKGYHYSRAMKALMNNALFLDSDNHPYIDPSKVIMAKGTLFPMWGGGAAQREREIELTWDNTLSPSPRRNSDDMLIWVLYDPRAKKVCSNLRSNGDIRRYKGEATVTLPDDLHGTFYLYAFFVNNVWDRVSNSVYLGEFRV